MTASLCLGILHFAVVVQLTVAQHGEDSHYNLPQDNLQINIYIGGLFEKANSSEELAFRSAVRHVNKHQMIKSKTLLPVVRIVSEYDSFQVEKTVCELAEYGVAAVYGPRSSATSHHVQSLCDTLEIPHLTARWDPSQRRSSCLVNLHPHPTALSKAITDIVLAWEWKGFTVLYDNYEALMKIQSLVKLADDRGYLVTVRQLSFHDEDGYRSVLQEIKYSEEKNLVIECSVDILRDVLIQAQQVGLMGVDYSYIITSLDFQTIDYTPFKWGRTNLTAVRLVDPDRDYVRQTAASWGSPQATDEAIEEVTHEEYDYGDYGEENQTAATPTTTAATPAVQAHSIPNLDSALVYDAVIIFAKSLNHFGAVPISPLQCYERSSFFKYGYSLVNYIRLSELEGMTGGVRFDHEGFRTEIHLDVLELNVRGLEKRGTWNGSLALFRPEPGGVYPDDGEDLRNVTFTVLIALTHPYNMLKQDSSPLIGNERYEGFGVDLIHELSLMSGFNYTFKEHSDKNSGNPTVFPNGTRTWDGMIGEVLAGRADMAIADITITDERSRDADFTDPFMNLGISILHRKPTKAQPSLFTFMSPFSSEVWAYMMSAYVGVSFLLFVMARISPYEWTNPFPCVEEPEALENQFSLNNAFWFTVGSLMQQGSDVAPIAASTRIVGSVWWFFTLIMVSSYTAQLASFLTYEIPVQPFKTVEELANQNMIKYGAKDGGSTSNFFRDSKEPTYQRISGFMNANKNCMQNSNEAGVDRVLREKNYAFFMESTSIEYEVERKCDLAQVGGLLDHKGYGIVMKQNSTYRNVLSKHIVKLQEKGKLAVIKDKWWKEKRGGGACKNQGEPGEASELSLDNTGGVFVVLLGGCIVATFVAFCEVIWDIYQRENKEGRETYFDPFYDRLNGFRGLEDTSALYLISASSQSCAICRSKRIKISFRDELREELKFILKCRSGVKPVRNPSLGEFNDVIRRPSS